MIQAVSHRLAPLLVVLVLAGCASGYKEFYRQAPGAEATAARRAAPPPTEPIVERARPGDTRAIRDAYAKRGYIIIGYSMLDRARPDADDSAVRQAQDVGADLVLIVYSTGTASASGPRGAVVPYGSDPTAKYGTSRSYVPITVDQLDYGAFYFVKQRFSSVSSAGT